MKLTSILLFILPLIYSCKNKALDEALDQAQKNRSELEKVIDHFRISGDKQKLEATYFLIENMNNKYSLEGKSLEVYFNVYSDIVKIFNSGIRENHKLDSIAGVKIDSLEAYYGPINYNNLDNKPDLQNIKANQLIENIDLAFEVWRKKPWAKHVSFEQFCDYILPYRVANEPMQAWRPYLYNKYKFLTDSLKTPNDPKEITRKVCDYIIKDWKRLDNFDKCSYYPGIISLDSYKGGICENHYLFLTALLRSLGVAIAIDNTPQWRNYPGQHSWLMLIDITGKPIFFNPGNPKYNYTNKVTMGSTGTTTKVYRKSFKINKISLPESIDNTEMHFGYFTNKTLQDVTSEYQYEQINLIIPVKNPVSKIMYLTTFGSAYQTVAIAWAKIDNNKSVFNNLGYPAVYLPVIVENDHENPIQNPILVRSSSEQVILNPDTANKITVKLTSKFPMSDSMVLFAKEIIGSKFQGSNTLDFNNVEDLYTIKEVNNAFEEVSITNTKQYRYVRFQQANNTRINIAEIEFYNNNSIIKGKPIGFGKTIKGTYYSPFDNDIKSVLTSSPQSWVGLDFGKPATIDKIKYLIRNDLNTIEPGDIYELFYFNNNWFSLGRIIAENTFIEYTNVPKNALLVLRNISKGKDERIFTYENGKQVWW